MFKLINAHILCPCKTIPKPAFQRKHLDILLMNTPGNSLIIKRGSFNICFQKQDGIKKSTFVCLFVFFPFFFFPLFSSPSPFHYLDKMQESLILCSQKLTIFFKALVIWTLSYTWNHCDHSSPKALASLSSLTQVSLWRSR